MITHPRSNNSTDVLIKQGGNDEKRAQENREKLNHMTLKPGLERWKYQRMLKAAEEFDRIVMGDAWVRFWNRKNVIRAVERSDVTLVEYWLMSKLWLVRQGIGVES